MSDHYEKWLKEECPKYFHDVSGKNLIEKNKLFLQGGDWNWQSNFNQEGTDDAKLKYEFEKLNKIKPTFVNDKLSTSAFGLFSKPASKKTEEQEEDFVADKKEKNTP